MSLIIASVISVNYELLVFVANLRSVVTLWRLYGRNLLNVITHFNQNYELNATVLSVATEDLQSCGSRRSMAADERDCGTYFTVHLTASGQSAVNSRRFSLERSSRSRTFVSVRMTVTW